MALVSGEPAYKISACQHALRRLTGGLAMFLVMYESFWNTDRTLLHGLRRRDLPVAKLPTLFYLTGLLFALAALGCQLYYFIRRREARLWKPRWKAAGEMASRHEVLMVCTYGVLSVMLLANTWVALNTSWPG